MDWIKTIAAAGALAAVLWLAPLIIKSMTRKALPKCMAAGVWCSGALARALGNKARAEKIESELQIAVVDAFMAFMNGCDRGEKGNQAWKNRLCHLLDLSR